MPAGTFGDDLALRYNYHIHSRFAFYPVLPSAAGNPGVLCRLDASDPPCTGPPRILTDIHTFCTLTWTSRYVCAPRRMKGFSVWRLM